MQEYHFGSLVFLSKITQCLTLPTFSLQHALAKAVVQELATVHGTKYSYGAGASVFCKYYCQAHSQRSTLELRGLPQV